MQPPLNVDLGSHVVASVPYHTCHRYVRRAVEGLLSQTHRNLTVVVVNDGDHRTPPWPELAHIRDPRLVRFDLPVNRGPYYAHALVCQSMAAPYLAIQDADDWSEATRLQTMLCQLKADRSDFATTAQIEVDESGVCKQFRWAKPPLRENPSYMLCANPGPEYVNRCPHHGLFRSGWIRLIGGYYGGFKINYDVFLMNVMTMTGRISHTNLPLYRYTLTQDSLSRGESLGYRSEERRRVKGILSDMHRRVYAEYGKLLERRISASSFFAAIRGIGQRHVTDEARRSLSQDADRLSAQLPLQIRASS